MTTTQNPVATDFSALEARFETAWTDLGERLSHAVRELTEMFVTANTAQANRLMDKTTAVSHALICHKTFSAAVGVVPGVTYASVWRKFTIRIKEAIDLEQSKPSLNKAILDGYAVVLSYQTGYGNDINLEPVARLY